MSPRIIALLIFDDFQILDAAGPIAAFEIAARIAPGAYAVRTIAAAPGLVRSSSGVAIAAAGFASARRCDTLLVAGGLGARAAATDAATLAFVKRKSVRARRMASVCSGAYVLAAAGLLDGRRATTHWSRSRDFQRRFPKVLLEPDLIFVRDGAVWSSAGITAGIDLALAMIYDDLGEEIARAVARQLVVYHRRPGGQSQFSALLELESRQDKFVTLLRWAGERLQDRLAVEDLAVEAGMSPRNFARAFSRATGVTPAKAIERLRLDKAKSALESGDGSIETIARASGFCDPDRMRRAFLRIYGQPPQAFRRLARRGYDSARPAS